MHTVFKLEGIFKERKGAESYSLEIPSFRVQKGETLALTGPSGCGKSTALDLLSCALRPDGGKSFIFSPEAGEPRDVLASWRRGGINALADLRMRHLGCVLQTGGLLPFLSARNNIMLVPKMLGIVHKRLEAIKEMAETLGILKLLGKLPEALSVGERQRVAIVKALAHGPSVVLADEPTAALDPKNSKTVMKLFLELAKSEGASVVMATHERSLAEESGFTLVPINLIESDTGVVAGLLYPYAGV